MCWLLPAIAEVTYYERILGKSAKFKGYLIVDCGISFLRTCGTWINVIPLRAGDGGYWEPRPASVDEDGCLGLPTTVQPVLEVTPDWYKPPEEITGGRSR